ncbi:hypothetical protein P689_11945 [Candidatus Riesia pediculischaeffi PTSU]|uniref:Uncharacterized protein n=1 Tax=Candidatus Riesia pediculischaeffi PTSU TaxID=1401651 RepID=A0A0C1V6K6_9ENTR|nr:hypothetical protein P689_11945 [Candidatus Riesia pediculischaeffi PTSU]
MIFFVEQLINTVHILLKIYFSLTMRCPYIIERYRYSQEKVF